MTNPIAESFYATHATPAELSRVLGPRWAICRNTERNRARYGRCITRQEYQLAQSEALDTRGFPNTTWTERGVLRAMGYKSLSESADALIQMGRSRVLVEQQMKHLLGKRTRRRA